VNENIAKLKAKIDALALRERALILLCAMAVMGLLLQSQLIDPLLQERGVISSKARTLALDIAQQASQRTLLEAEISAGVNRYKIARRDQLRSEMELLNERIEESVVAMIPPRLMPQVLENILAQNSSLTLLAIENQPVVALMTHSDDSGEEAVGNAADKGLYRHAFVLTLEGNYLAAIDYFEALEAMPWRFVWHELSLNVTQYPTATIILTVHTVSMSEEVLGV